MEFKVVKAAEIENQNFGPVNVKNLFNEEDYDKFSVAKVEIVGEQKFGLDKESDTAYYVLEGHGKFFIEDKEFEVSKGDLVFIPQGVKYKDTEGLKLLAIAVPKFDRDARVRFD